MHPTYIEIDTQQFIANLNAIYRHVAPAKVCLPVKANAYGHGLIEIAKLASLHVDYLAVSCFAEGVTLRQHGIDKPILVFGAAHAAQLADLIRYTLEITVASRIQVDQVVEHARKLQQPAQIQLKIDTGMNRIGINVDMAQELLEYILVQQELRLTGIYSHLACSDEIDQQFSQQQIRQFSEIAHYAKMMQPNILCHIANSGAICSYSDSLFDMIRPGILSYGYLPANLLGHQCSNWIHEIKPCFSLKSTISYSKLVAANQGVSYNLRYTTKAPTQIVTIPLGYGDGYRRSLSNCGEVLIRGRKYAISGTICMDMLMVDICSIQADLAQVNDEVVFIGRQGDELITLESVAAKCQSITYEMLCALNTRIPRVYI